MARSKRRAKRGGIGSALVNLINPLRDPSLLFAIIIWVFVGGISVRPVYNSAIFFVLIWIAAKSILWFAVNFIFSSAFLLRKTGWVLRNPRLAWRLLDALGTEEIIIGGLRPDMFATEEGGLHQGNLGNVVAAGLGGYGPGFGALPGGYGQGYEGQGGYDYGQGPDPRSEELHELLGAYARLISDWTQFTEEKWRTVSDSQLAWKPLRGRWNSWDEIYEDSFAVNTNDPMAQAAQAAGEAMYRRFNNAHEKGSAASAVACFLRDLDTLRQSLAMLDAPDGAGTPRLGGIGPQQPISQRTGKNSSIIRNPMIVDAE